MLENYTIRREQLASPQDLEYIDQMVKSRGTARSDILTVTTFPLQNAAISLRAGTSDAVVYYETFLGLYHIPPRLPATVETLLDLGANIGLTAAHYCVLFPTCRILAVEPDTSMCGACDSKYANLERAMSNRKCSGLEG